MSKIVFFDIDGTLLDHDKKLPESTKLAIKTLQDNGTYVAIATGRAPFMFKNLREELGINTFVSFNGQYVVFEDEVIYQNPLATDELESLFAVSEKNGHPLIFMNNQTMKASVRHHEHIETSLGSLNFPHPEEDKEFFKNNPVFQALIFCDENQEKPYVSNYPGFKFVRWHPVSTDVVPANGSKAVGIQHLIKRLGFNLKDVYAFGDGLNDMEMIKTVGTGVVMGNASDVLKQNADYITADVGEEGIWKGLKHLALI
jgi:Cof subfamily protein (haloacid dehalogenase superfamily)